MPDRVSRTINGPRGSVLLAGMVVAFGHAIAFFPSPAFLPSGLEMVGQIVPLSVYAGFWFVTSLVALFGATTQRGKQRDRLDAWGFGLLAGMLSLWGATYLLGWAVQMPEGSRAWLVGILYLGVAWLVVESARMTNPGPRTHAR
jgi:hypothetical protein